MIYVILQIIQIFMMVALLLLFLKTLPAYAVKKGENRADIEDAQRISYEEERGRNLATKEDIDTVIKELEKVKSEVSLREQRKHNLIEKRNENLLGVVAAAERIRIMRIRLASLINGRDTRNLAIFIDDTSETLVTLRRNVQVVTALTMDENELDQLQLFSYDIIATGTKFIESATNAISMIDVYEQLSSRLDSSASRNREYLQNEITKVEEKIEQLKDDILSNKDLDTWLKHEEQFIKYLNQLFKKDQMIAYK